MKKYLIIALFVSVSAQAENNSFLQKIDKDQDILLLALKEVNGKSIDIQKIKKNTVATHTLEELSQIQKSKKEKKPIRESKVTKKEAKAIIVRDIKNINATTTNEVKHVSFVEDMGKTSGKVTYHEIKDKDLKEVGMSTSPLNKSKLNVSIDQAYRDAVREME